MKLTMRGVLSVDGTSVDTSDVPLTSDNTEIRRTAIVKDEDGYEYAISIYTCVRKIRLKKEEQ